MDPRVAALPQNRSQPKLKPSLCPVMGCTLADESDRGYCRHIYGWTIDGTSIDVRHNPGTDKEVCHHDAANEDHYVKADDVIVEMPTVTSRVYRLGPADKLKTDSTSRQGDKDMAAMQAMVSELREDQKSALDMMAEMQAEMKQLREERDAARKQSLVPVG
jgi:hypothetical protein